MLKSEEGFTLIELVVVIVILGILAATAIPKFIDLSSEAKQAAVEGVAGTLASASAINYAARSVTTSKGVSIATCSAVAGALQGGLPTSYVITSGAITAGGSTACKVSGPDGQSATFTGIGIS